MESSALDIFGGKQVEFMRLLDWNAQQLVQQ